MTTKREYERRTMMNDNLRSLGFTRDECESLRRISMTLHNWHERECGTDYGCIERENDDGTGRAFWLDSRTMKRYPIRDMETGALKRLERIISLRNAREYNPTVVNGKRLPGPMDQGAVSAYVQTDPRGAPLYILRPGDVPGGQTANGYYSRGICVC